MSVAVCPLITDTGHEQWPCVRAAGHDGDCRLPIEADHYTTSLDRRSPEWLVSEARVLLYRIEALERERRADTTSAVLGRLVRRLRVLAPHNTNRKTVPLDQVRAAVDEAVNGSWQ